jgi:uncharacterized ion transporter superfamily protein YfcC
MFVIMAGSAYAGVRFFLRHGVQAHLRARVVVSVITLTVLVCIFVVGISTGWWISRYAMAIVMVSPTFSLAGELARDRAKKRLAERPNPIDAGPAVV